MKEKLKAIPVLAIAFGITVMIFLLGFNNDRNIDPKTIYRVYVDGKSIGAISNKKELENYINNEQVALKNKYNVDKIYLPVGLEIKKEITYNNDISSAKKIYNKIKNLKPFTISGYVITIKGANEKKVNVLNKDIFIQAADKTIRSFVNGNEYDKFLQNNQKEIVDVGKKIKNVYIEEKIVTKKTNISTDEQIFTNANDLAKYLLFGTLKEQDRYTVQIGDDIQKVAYNNKLNVDEFLVANPNFTDVNNLLYVGQQVIVGLITPQFSVVEERYVVEDKIKQYKTEIIYDPKMLVGNGYERQAGVNGLDRVTEEIKIVNGNIVNINPAGINELKPAINRIYVKGGRALPNIGDNSFWAWPTNPGYTITSGFYDYRFVSGYGRKQHNAIDIGGCGYGSSIFAANNGTVYETGYSSTNGNYIEINHNNGYYTYYGHLSRINVREGQVVERGQKIGEMGNSGYYNGGKVGTHLHFQVFIGIPFVGPSVNPTKLY